MSGSTNYPSLHLRSVVITGGATGIGETLVRQFVAQGAQVAFIDRDAKAGAALAADLAGSAQPPLFVAADLTDFAALTSVFDQCRAHTGPIAVLINNAANDQRHRIEDTTPQSWDEGVATNLKHQFFAVRQVIDDMKSLGGGSIINFGSVSWMLKQGGMPVYTTSKSAVQGLTRSLARDLGPFNIRVNTIVPGWVMTDKQVRLWLDDRGREDIRRGQCLQAPLLPVHIASMALFLAADDSAMCTAQDFVVDGGWT